MVETMPATPSTSTCGFHMMRFLFVVVLAILSSTTAVDPTPGEVCGVVGKDCVCNKKEGCCKDCFWNKNLKCRSKRISACPSHPGDVCGVPGTDCPALRCACGLCDDGVNQFGCCSDCVLDQNLECQSISTCPPKPGDVCGVPGIDCPALRCACGLCDDGVNQFGCCSDCVLDEHLECQSISTCPKPKPGDVCGVPGEDCPALECACGLCDDGVNEFGCCGDCVLDENLKCQSISTCPLG